MLLARSSQNPPLIVVAGTDVAAGGASLIKTWVASKVTSPANVIDIAAQLKVGRLASDTDSILSKIGPLLACLHLINFICLHFTGYV